MKVNDRVKVVKKNSPLFGKEFIVKKVNEGKQTVDLIDHMAQEITYPIKDVQPLNEANSVISVSTSTSSVISAEVLFEFDGTLVDQNGVPNSIIINKFKNLSSHYKVGIFSYRANDKTDDTIPKFISANLGDLPAIEVSSSIGKDTKLLFSSRVVRVAKDGTDFCPMCLVSNDYTTYEANILECMFNNIGGPQG